MPILLFFSYMASIDCYFKTEIFCHQVGSAHKKKTLLTVNTICKHKIGLWDCVSRVYHKNAIQLSTDLQWLWLHEAEYQCREESSSCSLRPTVLQSWASDLIKHTWTSAPSSSGSLSLHCRTQEQGSRPRK